MDKVCTKQAWRGQRWAVRHAAYHTNTAHLTGTQTLSRVDRGDTSPAPFQIRPIPTRG